ncbi:MAG: hypothetical protein CBC35_07535 [Planctomycetes bacterium TMED75]|nr:hypothetical protein [Planctomycetaceae bacterium]OUU92208.1 MAG: hypothetical protein CBC35_07535 [Planctomycetes bacterium TMED75]
MKIQGTHPAVIAAYARTPSVPGPASAPPAGSFELQSRGPIQAASGNTKLADLVAGTVPSGINRGEGFDPVSPGPFPRQTLQLYSNSAERMEAATRVEVGQILDTTA